MAEEEKEKEKKKKTERQEQSRETLKDRDGFNMKEGDVEAAGERRGRTE